MTMSLRSTAGPDVLLAASAARAGVSRPPFVLDAALAAVADHSALRESIVVRLQLERRELLARPGRA